MLKVIVSKLRPMPRKALSAILALVLVLSVSLVPGAVTASAAYADEKTFNFEADSGTVYGTDATVKDESGKARQISGKGFTSAAPGGNGVLRLSDTRGEKTANNTWYAFNDASGLYQLDAGASYIVSLKFSVISNQIGIDHNGVIYPTSTQNTYVNLVYGLNVADGKLTSTSGYIGNIATLTNGGTTFTRKIEENKVDTLPVGQWHELTFTFSTPDKFTGDNVLGFEARTYNGAELRFDDIYVAKIPYITLVTDNGTLENKKIPVVIGEKVDLPNPVYKKFGTDFDGWYLDKNCTKKFTDEYYTEENCELTLYAGWSNTHFSFESYTGSYVNQGVGYNYHHIITDNSDLAYDGRNYLEYRYTSDRYNAEGAATNNTVNHVSLKNVEPHTTYIVTFKYMMPKGSGDATIYMATGNENVWQSNTRVDYPESTLTLSADIPDVWREGRMAFTTGDLDAVINAIGQTLKTDYARIFLYSVKSKVDTIVYLDDVTIEEVTGDTTVTLNAAGGQFADGSKEKVQEITVGDKIASLEHPVKAGYDFAGWSYDVSGSAPVTADTVDGTVFRNTVYAVWTRNMGFESYYYDLEAENRNDYVSDTVSIVKDNPQKGFYSAKLNDTAGGKRNVIALNPVSNSTRYLVTFYYSLSSAASDVEVKFATMNNNINNESEVTVYDGAYTIPATDAKKGYIMGAAIIETDCKNAASNRLAMLISSASGAYTVYFDTVEITALSNNKGYAILCDELNGEYTAVIGKIGKEVTLYDPQSVTDKFIGWYTDKETTNLYDGGYTYSETPIYLYAGWVEGEGFENYTTTNSNISVIQDSSDKNNKYIRVKGNVSEKIADAVSSTRYGVEFRYSLSSATANTVISVGNSSFTVSADEVSSGWQKATLVVTAQSEALSLEIAGNSSLALLIDDLIVYEIRENMSVITFNQKDGYGEDSVQVGVKGTVVTLPVVQSHGTDVFYGWYSDEALKVPFASMVFPASDSTLYARWVANPVTNISFDDFSDYNNLSYYNENNTNSAYVTSAYKKHGKYSLALDRMAEGTYDTYAPIANADGFMTLESNTTYAISYYYYFNSYSSGATSTLEFYASSADAFSKTNKVGSAAIKHGYSFRMSYAYFTTGDIPSGENVLYAVITSGYQRSVIYIDTLRITRVDAGRNHVFCIDTKNSSGIYEVDGNQGEEISYPVITDANYEVEGWYTDAETLNHHSSGKHKSEPVTELYCRWDIQTITFDNYQFENNISKYTVGDDISLSAMERYDSSRSLKYSYNYAVNYFETANNAACMGRVVDNSTYKISFRYKLTDAQGDVNIKFLTANLTNRWAYITNYDEATYTVYSAEIGDDWKQATVYLTTDFASISTSGLFMTFNPVVEGATVLYIDAVEIDYLRSDSAIAAFVGKNGNAEVYVEANTGDSVSAPKEIPASQFAAFGGWYTDKECTEEFTSVTLSSGLNFVYSAWTEKAENFDNYTYASNDEANFAKGNVIDNGVLTYTAENENSVVANGFRIGKIDNNTSYKVTFDYKTSSADTKIKLATADEMNISVNTTAYNDEGNFVLATQDGEWHTATVYFTSSFGYTVPKDKYVNAIENKNAVYGDMLYMYFENQAGAVISIDNISLTEVDVLYSGGTAVLKEEESKEAGSQALRFFFSYPTADIMTVNVGGEKMTVAERGIIFKNARNTATGTAQGEDIAVRAISLEVKNEKGHTYISKTNSFNQYWDYDNKTGSLVFSGYVKDFNLKDSRLVAARGYVKLKDSDGNIYTFYSADKKATVKDGVEKTSEITDKEVHTFADVTWDNFTIVNPKSMSYIYGRQIEFLMEYAKDTHKVTLSRITEKASETAYEIVIGDTKRAASGLISVEDENEYVIAVRGTKVIIKGGSDLATMQGVKDFIDYLKLKDSLSCGADIRDGYTKYGKVATTADDYALTFNDDFNGTSINTQIWGAYSNQDKTNNYADTSQFGGKHYVYSVGDSYTTLSGMKVDSAVFVRDGNAVLTTARISEKDIVMTRLSTYWNMLFQYGYVEFRCKLSAPPSYSSLWMNGGFTDDKVFVERFGRENRGCMTEYDLIETYGKQDFYGSAIHHWWTATSVKDTGHVSLSDDYGIGTKSQYYTPAEDEVSLNDNYHIYTFLWENDRLIFAFDGVKYYEYENYDYYYDRMANYIILGQGVGNRDYGVEYDPTVHGEYFETLVDYVRIYQQENMGSILKYSKH